VGTAEIAISLDAELLGRLDGLVRRRVFPSRSRAIQATVEEKIARLERTRLAREGAKLDPIREAALAEESADRASRGRQPTC
jgi:metal-responsive CopG/Arc/MetJ family transcriptional regulator